jgi:hypothetical protein
LERFKDAAAPKAALFRLEGFPSDVRVAETWGWVMQLALQHSLVYQDTDEAGKRFPNVS